MKIGILQTGRTPDEMRDKHGDYDDLFKRLLAGRDFSFDTYPALDGVLPDSVNAADGWLITGSKFGAYEPHDWIKELEVFLRQVFAAGVPIVGVCFGHQVLAQALGGKVEKFSGGWSIGPADYDAHEGDSERIIAWHQDQVTELPEGAEVIASSDFCQNAILAYGDKALTLQPHPEFTAEFFVDLLQARRDVIPADIAAKGASRKEDQLTSTGYADRIEAFFKQPRAGHNGP